MISLKMPPVFWNANAMHDGAIETTSLLRQKLLMSGQERAFASAMIVSR